MTPLKGGDGSRLPSGQQLVFQLSHATEQTAPSDCHPSSMGVLRFHLSPLSPTVWSPGSITSESDQQFGCSLPLSIWYGQPEHNADRAVWSLTLTEIRCPCFIKETWTHPTGAGSRNADKDVTPKILWGKEKASLFSRFRGNVGLVAETEKNEKSGQKSSKKKYGCSCSLG